LVSSCANNESAVNPLLEEWNTPYQIPPFESVKAEHYIPAFKTAMAAHLAEIDQIVNNEAEPTFENTILAYDKSGELLSNVSAVFSSVSGVDSNDEIRAIATELSPLRSAHSSAISLNDKLFQRVKSVYERRDSLNLDADQKRLVELIYKGFERSGANLSVEKKEELKEVNARISALQLQFGQNMLKETAAYTLVIENEADLSGLTENQIAEAASRAKKAGAEGKWYFGLDNPSIMPFLANADNRALREDILTAYLNRCNNNNSEDNKAVIKELIDLRLKRAQIMGCETAADFILDDRMAKTSKAVYDLLDQG
jgi:peptidyl-dipeptidase Dcp